MSLHQNLSSRFCYLKISHGTLLSQQKYNIIMGNDFFPVVSDKQVVFLPQPEEKQRRRESSTHGECGATFWLSAALPACFAFPSRFTRTAIDLERKLLDK